MNFLPNKGLSALVPLLAGALFLSSPSYAQGDEVLNPVTDPDITEALSNGSKIRISGTGLHSLPDTPGSISITLNPGETVERVLLYWQVFDSEPIYDVDIDVERLGDGFSNMVTGQVIGEHVPFTGGAPKKSFYNAYSATIRADITDLNLIKPGENTLLISGLEDVELPNPNFGDSPTNGAGIMLIVSDGSNANLQLVDGHDAAWWERSYPDSDKFSETLGFTVPVRFQFEAMNVDRFADLSMFVASVEGDGQTGNDRPSVVVIRGGDDPANEIRDANVLMSNRGDEWDDYIRSVPIPAGVDFIEVEIFSQTDPFVDPLSVLNPDGSKTIDPASFVWLAAGLSTPQEVENACVCKPKKLTFTYVGGSCSATSNGQHGKAKCKGNLYNADHVKVYSMSRYGPRVMNHYVSKGGELTLAAKWGHHFPAHTRLLLKSGHKWQWLEIHTSCSKPLNTGDQFGPLVLTGFESSDKCDKDKCKKKKKKKGKYGHHGKYAQHGKQDRYFPSCKADDDKDHHKKKWNDDDD